MRISLTARDAVSARSALCGGLPPPAFSAHKQRELKQKCVRDALWDRLRGPPSVKKGHGLRKGSIAAFRHDTLQRGLPVLSLPHAPFHVTVRRLSR